jgi:hypothetical protein
MEYAIYLALVSAFLGGIIARLKGDYFSRGFFICLFTNIIGIVALVLSKSSQARSGNENDYHNWPEYGSYAVLVVLGIIILAVILSLII